MLFLIKNEVILVKKFLFLFLMFDSMVGLLIFNLKNVIIIKIYSYICFYIL